MIALMAAAAALAGAAPLQPASPSFDCGRAASAGERLVCADPALAAADRDMATRYKSAIANSADMPALRRAQRSALAARDACTTRTCVVEWYAARARALASPGTLRLAVGQCTATRIARIGPRVEGAPESGTFIAYADGLTQASYDPLPGAGQSRRGDPVRLCLVSRPRGCPAGDARGSTYAARNGRTGQRWTAADSSHVCGGA